MTPTHARTPGTPPGAAACPRIGGVPVGGVTEVAALLDTSPAHVAMLHTRRTRGFPEPVARLRGGPIFDMRDVEAWKAAEDERD